MSDNEKTLTITADYDVHQAVLRYLHEQDVIEIPWEMQILIAGQTFNGDSFATVQIDLAKLETMTQNALEQRELDRMARNRHDELQKKSQLDS